MGKGVESRGCRGSRSVQWRINEQGGKMKTQVGFLSENKAGWEGGGFGQQRSLVHYFESREKWKNAIYSSTHSLRPNNSVSHSWWLQYRNNSLKKRIGNHFIKTSCFSCLFVLIWYCFWNRNLLPRLASNSWFSCLSLSSWNYRRRPPRSTKFSFC